MAWRSVYRQFRALPRGQWAICGPFGNLPLKRRPPLFHKRRFLTTTDPAPAGSRLVRCLQGIIVACDTALGMSRYQAEWERMRSRRNGIFLLLVAEFFALPLVGIAVTSVERTLFSSAHAVLPVSITWGVLFLLTGHRLRVFPRPRCGKNFSGKIGGPQEFLDRRCAYCGLKRGS